MPAHQAFILFLIVIITMAVCAAAYEFIIKPWLIRRQAQRREKRPRGFDLEKILRDANRSKAVTQAVPVEEIESLEHRILRRNIKPLPKGTVLVSETEFPGNWRDYEPESKSTP